MNLTIDAKVEGKYPAVMVGTKKYNVTADVFNRVQVGQSYQVTLKERKITSKKDGKEYTFNDIVDVAPTMASNGSGSPVLAPNGVGAGESVKAQNIAKACSLNAASTMVEAFSTAWRATEVIKGRSEDEIKAMLSALKLSEYKENCALLGVKDEEVPF